MKVIDLLNEVAKGKPIKKFKFKGDIFDYYERASTLEELYYYDNIEWLSRENINLNDEVEIIEEVEEDEFEDIRELGIPEIDRVENERICRAEYKINALIKNQKKIIEQLKNK